MTTAYSPILKLALPVTGELDGAWGDVVNDNITSMVEEAIAGLASISTWVGASHTLTTADGTTSESRCAILQCSGAPGAAATVVCPAVTKLYVLKNGVTGGYAVTLKTASGTGISVPNGKVMWLYCDGTNVVDATTHLSSLTLGSALPVASGGTGVATLTGIVKASGTSAFSAAVAGTDYLAPPSGTAILKANSGGALVNAVAGTDYVSPTGTETLTNKTLAGAVLNDGYTEEVFAVTGNTPALSPANGSIQTWAITAAATPTAGTWAAGQSMTLMVVSSGGTYDVTWTSIGVVWVGGAKPVIPTSGYAVATLWKVGTTVYGSYTGDVA